MCAIFMEQELLTLLEHMMFIWFNSKIICATYVKQELLTLPEHMISPLFFCGFYHNLYCSSLVLCVVFCRLLFVFLAWYCLSFDSWLLIGIFKHFLYSFCKKSCSTKVHLILKYRSLYPFLNPSDVFVSCPLKLLNLLKGNQTLWRSDIGKRGIRY